MPATLVITNTKNQRGIRTKAYLPVRTCEECGDTNAPFVVGGSIREAISLHQRGYVGLALAALGKSYCHRHSAFWEVSTCKAS